MTRQLDTYSVSVRYVNKCTEGCYRLVQVPTRDNNQVLVKKKKKKNTTAKTKELMLITHFVIWREKCNRIFREKKKQQKNGWMNWYS